MPTMKRTKPPVAKIRRFKRSKISQRKKAPVKRMLVSLYNQRLLKLPSGTRKIYKRQRAKGSKATRVQQKVLSLWETTAQ